MLEIEKSVNPPKEAKKKLKKEVTKRCSHLYLQETNLKAVPKLSPSKDLHVIYLYSNSIREITNIDGTSFPNLTSLYLQNNQISKLENLNLKKLRNLYIGYNNISVVEGLENLINLEELHIEKQNLPDGTAMCFDPRTVLSLSRTLQVLNISHNKISSFVNLSSLIELVSIDASYCELDDLKEVCSTIADWKYLSRAYFQGNIFSKNHRYKEDIITSCYYLESLDGKEVSDTTRSFLKRLECQKLQRSKHTVPSIPNLAEVVDTLPKNYSQSIQKTVSAAVLKGKKYIPFNSSSISEAENNTHISWTGLPRRRPFARSLKNKPNSTIDHSVIINKFP